MVVPPSTGGVVQAHNVATKSMNGARTNGVPAHLAPPAFPYSARRAPRLDINSVERKGHPASREPPVRSRPHGLPEAPIYRPTEAEFRDPMEYIRSISEKASKYGICKIIPPENWNPDFAIDSERFHFRTRKQEINLVEGGNRTNLNYLDQLGKFHKQYGTHLNRLPSVDKRPLDLYKLKKAVEIRGGFEKVCKDKKWAEIGRDLGYSGKIMSSLSTSLKNSYQRWLHPYEEWLKHAKPGFQHPTDYEFPGSQSAYPASHHQSPASASTLPRAAPPAAATSSPAVQASRALQGHVESPRPPSHGSPLPTVAPRPAASAAFTAVRPGGFAAVNAPSGFTAVNTAPPPAPVKVEANGVNQMLNGGGFAAVNGYNHQPALSNGHPVTNGSAKSNPLKRAMSHDSLNGDSGSDSAHMDGDKGSGRRSKRPKKSLDGNGSNLRASTPQPRPRSTPRQPGEKCETCGKSDDKPSIIVCDGCDLGYHRYCLDPPLATVPEYDWHCSKCLVGNHEYGFEEGNIYSLKTFQDKAKGFKDNYFANRTPFDPITNKPRLPTEDDVEREFWRLVEDITESVEVEYGADIHSTTHGSGFPTVERKPLDPYARDAWNLNVMPFLEDSLFRHIKGDISGMTVPWLYVGMCFSTFCWHNEDHYAYSANYQHFGATKTWYGIPGKHALAFEAAMREAVPELFESQPDLLFQLVTILPPNQLRKAGVEVYALDQRAGEFVITFPQAYHAGFNHGFNFNEAVNFAPADWEPFGDAGVQRLRQFRRQPCFSHEELLFTAAASDGSIKTAQWLAPALERARNREIAHREEFALKHDAFRPHQACSLDQVAEQPNPDCGLLVTISDSDLVEEEYQCHHCKAFSYLSQFICIESGKISCLQHADVVDCCGASPEQRLRSHESMHKVVLRYTDDDLTAMVQKVVDKANVPQAWEARLEALLDGEARPALKQMHTLLTEGEKIPAPLIGLEDLAEFVKRCDVWVDEANLYLTRKQQNRRKNEKAWRRSSTRASKIDEKESEPQLTLERLKELIEDGEQLGFSAPQFEALQEKLATIDEWREVIKTVFEGRVTKDADELETMLEEGKAFMTAMPELTNLEKLCLRAQWGDQVEKARLDMINQSLDHCKALLKRATEELSIPAQHPQVAFLTEMVQKGDFWEIKAKEVMAAEDVHYPQLESLHNQVQAQSFPVNKETLAQMDAILAKNREAKRQIITLVERSHDPDFRKRPMYVHVRDVLKDLENLNGKPHGTADLEKELKRHEDWMRKGKKLFGKANAPLHILEQHMKFVDDRNSFCFDLNDTFRPPIEPASRDASPVEGQEKLGLSDEDKPVFCLCRQPEAGLMIECEICHDWYHAKCLKLARGKVKEYEMFTCPICDWRVKIPRDAARPKLEDLQGWADELPGLPFQPEEEGLLNRILDKAQSFREFLSPYINGNHLVRTSEEMPEMLFYLRKIEGAEVLLAYETNVFRQELHKWQPIASEAPPILDQSLSTRKPRPTKQQKLMKELGVEKPEDLPAHYRTKTYARRKTGDQLLHGQLMPKPESASGDSPPPHHGRSHTPPANPREDSTGNAPVHGGFEPDYIGGHHSTTSYGGSYNEGGPGSYATNNLPSPMFASPRGSQPPEVMRNPMVAAVLSGGLPEGSRDPAFSAFRHTGLGVGGDEDLRNGLAGISGDNGHPEPESSPAPGDFDNMFMEMTNEEDGEPVPALERETSQASEALEDVDKAEYEKNGAPATGDGKEGESAVFA